jgi:Ran GTPase-activating protein (RanGAP) involved in mRNA processing and transport
VLFTSTFLGDAGVSLLANTMRGNASITNLNLQECGVGDAGVQDLAQALAVNRKAALVALNLSHNTIGVPGSQSLASYLEATHTLTRLDLGYAHLGVASAPFIAQALKGHIPLTHLLVPGNDFQDEGASKFSSALATNTKLRVFNFQVIIPYLYIMFWLFFLFIFYFYISYIILLLLLLFFIINIMYFFRAMELQKKEQPNLRMPSHSVKCRY